MKVTILFLAGLFLVGCHAAIPGPGEQAVLIKKPFLFGDGGVAAAPVSTGRTYVALSTSVIYVNMQPFQIEQRFDDLMSSDGVPMSFDSFLRLQVLDSVGIIKNFGEKWLTNNIDAPFRNLVRQAVRKRGLNETAISTTAIDAIDAEVTIGMRDYIKQANLPILLVGVTIGKANPPDAVKHQRIDTATQEQRVNTEKQRKLAEDQRKAAEESRAAADNAYRLDMGLSADQFLRLEQIKMLHEVCVGGKCTFLMGNGVVPTMNAAGER